MLVNLHIYMLPSLINMCITYYLVCTVQVPGVYELQNVISSLCYLWTTSAISLLRTSRLSIFSSFLTFLQYNFST